MSITMGLLAEQPLVQNGRFHTNTLISSSSEPRGSTHEIISCAVLKKKLKKCLGPLLEDLVIRTQSKYRQMYRLIEIILRRILMFASAEPEFTLNHEGFKEFPWEYSHLPRKFIMPIPCFNSCFHFHLQM